MSLREFGEEATGERAGGSKDVVHKCWTPKVATLSLAPSVAKPSTGMMCVCVCFINSLSYSDRKEILYEK